MRYRAAVIGCGRIGAGLGWPENPPYVYDHCSAYREMADRVELAWVFDKYHGNAAAASLKFKVPNAARHDHECSQCANEALVEVLRDHPVDIVSVCVRPEDRAGVMGALMTSTIIRGAWIEKPLGPTSLPVLWEVNVNFVRRADNTHRMIASGRRVKELWVWAKRDEVTVCHFTDLARFWGVAKEHFHYFHMDGPNSYVAVMDDGSSRFFPLGGIEKGSPFMTRMLGNLLDAVEGKAELISPASGAIEAEAWADEILKGGR